MFGAKADGIFILASGTVSGTTLSGGYNYSAADVGKVGTIRGAGTGGKYFNFTITGSSGTSAIISPSAPTSVSGATVVFGTDAWGPIQAAIDWTVYGSIGPNFNPSGNNSKVYVDAGQYVVSDVISLGYGAEFNACVLEGAGPMSHTVGAGPLLYPLFSDRPLFAAQGARGTRVRKIGSQGLNYTYIATGTFLTGGALTVDDCVLANWVDPALSANANSRYAPYTCFAVDPYSGAAPTPAYPNVTYPSWYNGGSTAQYGKQHSSDVWFEDVFVSGYINGLSVQPCNDDSNGDFVRMTQSLVTSCARVLSVGNTQARETILDYVDTGTTHTVIATSANGAQGGKISGTILNSSFTSIQIFDIQNNTIVGPISLEGCYGENCWRLGVVKTASAAIQPFTMHNCQVSFEAQTDARGYPANNLDAGSTVAPISIENCGFNNFLNVLTFHTAAEGFRFVGCGIEPSPNSSLANPYEYLAQNALCGGVAVLPTIAGAHSPPLDISVKPNVLYDLDNSYSPTIYSAVIGSTNVSERRRCLSPYTKIARPRGLPSHQLNGPTGMVNAIGKTGGQIASTSLSGATLTVTFTGRSEAEFQLNGPLPGDVFYDDDSQTWFYVRSRSGNTVLADIRNNYRVVSGVRTQPGSSYGFNAYSATAGSLYFINSRIYTPFYYTQGDLTAASNSVTNVGRADTFYSGGIVAVGDYLYLDGTLDVSFASGTKVGAITVASPATFTMNTPTGAAANAAYAQVRKPLNYFVRQPPANV
jgi:hypothetical protein